MKKKEKIKKLKEENKTLKRELDILKEEIEIYKTILNLKDYNDCPNIPKIINYPLSTEPSVTWVDIRDVRKEV